MTRVVVIILHAAPEPNAGPLVRDFAASRTGNAEAHRRGFAALGVNSRLVHTHPDDPPLGSRLRAIARDQPGAGLVVLGSGSIPLATRADRRRLEAAAGELDPVVLVNNRYSADVLAIPARIDLAELPDFNHDNEIPRWFADRGITVHDLRDRWRLQVDLDSPVDVFLTGLRRRASANGLRDPALQRVRSAAARIRQTTARSTAEFLIAGRTSAGVLRWVERHTASRTRALIEERGMKTAQRDQRPTRTSLGTLLEHDGPAALGAVVAPLADAAVIDTRVLMAHQFGRAESAWPVAEDRFASDLLLHEQIENPWLRDLTRAALEASVPILLGGHTLVGPGLRLLLTEAPR